MDDESLIFQYLRMGHELHHADAIVCLGSSDLRVATFAAKLFHRGLAATLVFSGGIGTGPHSGRNLLGWERPEAEVMADEARRLGVPDDAILVEPESRNSGENIRFVHALLAARDLPPVESLIVVQKPFMERRAYATFMKQWPGATTPRIALASPPLSWEEYTAPGASLVKRDDIVAIMVGDLQRIRVYAAPPTEFQIPQEIPDAVWRAGGRLARAGFVGNLIGNAWDAAAETAGAAAGAAGAARSKPKRTLCARCARPPIVCCCAALPATALSCATRVVIVQHPKEARKAISSVPLIKLALGDACTVVVSDTVCFGLDDALDAALRDTRASALLFPSAASTPLDGGEGDDGAAAREAPRAGASTISTLLLVDGTWKQAKQMVQRSAACLDAVPRVMLATAVEGMYAGLRSEPRKHCVSTLEAAARALRALEPERANGVVVCDTMLAIFRHAVALQLAQKEEATKHFPPRPQPKCRSGKKAAPSRTGGAAGAPASSALAPDGGAAWGLFETVRSASDVVSHRVVRTLARCSYDAARAACDEENAGRRRGERLCVRPLPAAGAAT
jgi:DTW domain-containing protein YfiP/uncharacterized SAM-binding protein YcdF (DUF218 family)